MDLTINELGLIRAFLLENKGKTLSKLLKDVETEMLDMITLDSISHKPSTAGKVGENDGFDNHRNSESNPDDCLPLDSSVKEVVEADPVPDVVVREPEPEQTSTGETFTSLPTPLTELVELRNLFKQRKLPLRLKDSISERLKEEREHKEAGYSPQSILDYILTGNKNDLHY